MIAQVNQLSVRYGRRNAVDDISFELRAGELVLLLGPNGAGKSTTLSAMSGAITPTAGTITIAGQPVVTDAAKAKVGFADQPPALYEFFTVEEHVGFVAQARGGDRAEATAVLTQLGLQAIAARPCRELSFGMRQRVGLAAALVANTSVILLDETLNGLDPHATRHALAALTAATARGAAVLMSTHLLGSAERRCDRVMLMNKGKLIEDLHGDALAALAQRGPTALEDLYVERIADEGPT
ncbi:MAG TPA: ABC transporter ATP-binding protein [Kofleriaceae bacterium]|nr:ABC transporter ATP-binding protein [Kofleriaceae bacterium]